MASAVCLMSIGGECHSDTMPCWHACQVMDEQSQVSSKNLDGMTIQRFLGTQTVQKIENSCEEDHFKKTSAPDLQKLAAIEVSPVCTQNAYPGGPCAHFCTLVFSGGKEDKINLLAPLIKQILLDPTPRTVRNPFENDPEHFGLPLPTRSCCVIL